MSYSITPEQRVLKDGEDVGFIRDGICYTDNPPKGRGIASFRAMAGDPELQFKPLPETTITVATVDESKDFVPAVVVNWQPGIIPQDAEVLHSPPAYPEPAKSPVLGDRDPVWQRWFIATHGEAAFKAKWPTRKLP